MRRGTAPSRLPVVVVGQTPPPLHGQALAIERLVHADFERVMVHHVPMDFSSSIAEVGRFRLHKLARLARAIWRALKMRFSTGARVLYYPPAGPDMVPVLRDLVFLTVVRPFFPALVLELHAGGLERMEERLVPPLRQVFRHAYHGATVVLEKYPSPDSLPARRHLVVPNGIEDEFPRFRSVSGSQAGRVTILYVGMVTPRKGIWTLLDALSILVVRGVDVCGVVIGEFGTESVAAEWPEALRARGLEDHVRHTGPLRGDAKWLEFRGADIFCFASHHYEGCPLAVLEAMQFGLPVVASDRGGTPYLVTEGESGFLTPVGDAVAISDRLEKLARDPDLRERMGAAGRRAYLDRYTVGAYLEAVEDALVSASATGGPS